MSVETELAALTTQTTALLDVFNQQRASVATLIDAAVLTSVNAAKIPLVQITTAMTQTQTALITHAGA